MRLPLVGRRRRGLENLSKRIAASTDDEALANDLRKAKPEEVALVLASVSIERANQLLVNVPRETIVAALALPSEARLGAAVADELVAAKSEREERESDPVCIRALDFAGRYLGKNSA